MPVISAVLVLGILGVLIAKYGFTVPAFIEALRWLTKVSFLIFLLAFVTRPLHDVMNNRATSWLLANRRYVGLSFAVWHLIHWPILGSMMYLLGPATFWEYFGSFAIPAGSILLVITLLAATSNNASQRVLGKRLWGAIHTVGIYVIWGWFFKVYVLSKLPRVQHFEDKPYIFIYITLLFATMALRLLMAARRMSRSV